ncbi:peptidylprolyl isomerase [Methylotuvimicrobium buryatense]|uniref:Chaperone SurA n=1 Tax=Methylotuvimicrobium buryatense TaxID=95641 RepID=A0A4P9URD9_METBY|nr:peptidylprolyl isomerase [Methylotuvimicrobium buryatense]QCW84038.1 molecular chaperone SurA [Methylotuvimicrobium buryatense]
MKKHFISGVLIALISISVPVFSQTLDRIVAIVEDDVILDAELQAEVDVIAQRIKASNAVVPPSYILRKQVLEKLIIEKLQRQLAERSGIALNDEMLASAAADIARRNNMTPAQFRVELEKQSISYRSFLENLRNEVIINQLRGREIGSRVNVSDREVEHFLETESKLGGEATQYHLGHILVAIPEGASSAVIQKAKQKAEEIIQDLRGGRDFVQVAMSQSDGSEALTGGDLGWRSINQVPTLFVDEVGDMKEGDVSDPIRSPSGFHVLKMLELKGGDQQHIVTKTHVRHILIKTNELIDDDEAKKRLDNLKRRIADGDSFDALARAHSDDKGSALNGGSLDWVAPGALVPEFEEAMNALAIDEISKPVQTQFGWHLIQVLGRKQQDDSEDYKKEQVREAIRKRKIEEETELWLRRLRDEAYVEVFHDRL